MSPGQGLFGAVLGAVLSLSAPARAEAPHVSTGLVLSAPELFGMYASFWPLDTVTFELRVTLRSLDGGIMVHWPLTGSPKDARQAVLGAALGGLVHKQAGLFAQGAERQGSHLFLGAGYGYLTADFEARLLGGLEAVWPLGAASTRFGPSVVLMLGKVF